MQNFLRSIQAREQALRRFQCIDGLALKLIALVTMTIDHTAATLGCGGLYWPMRILGRIAFPIYCFLIVEGYFHTRSKGKYLLRLLGFFMVAEIPFDLAFSHTWYAPGYQNVLLTLAIGLAAVWAADQCGPWLEQHTGTAPSRWLVGILRFIIVLLGFLLGELFQTDYSGGGVLLILAFYFFRNYPICLTGVVTVLLYCFFGLVECPGILALIPIFLYNGERGKRLPGAVGKYGFYAYYPFHLLVLIGLRFALYGY